MVTIRLSRGGAKKKPFYHITVSDSRKSRDGRYIERIGFYNPLKNEETYLKLDLERLDYWVNNGAQLSPSVKSLRNESQKIAAQTESDAA